MRIRPCATVKSRGRELGRGLLVVAACLVVMGADLSGMAVAGEPDNGGRLSLNSGDPWSPQRDFPRLITPQWVGDEGVECVVTLAIDDMRDPAKYEAYLRPILQRLKQIDGRAPVSIMTCQVNPDDPRLQEWLNEGLSLECHTVDHPCPILAGGDIRKSKSTYDRCVDLISSIPNNRPVAFRTPCCDSLNTVSPRLFSEIITRTTPAGHFLQLDSSVFTLYTAADPGLPRGLLTDPDGKEKFRKYIPRRLARGGLVHDGFVNTIENYPYPYVIQKTCWEFPCMVPSDWSANHLHQPNNPDTVRDLKAALDLTVHKQGVFNLVFHPHGWIKSEQVIELIDHAVATHGKKVKFLNFRECLQRLNTNLLNGTPLRNPDGSDASVRLVDVNQDGLLDVVRADRETKWSRIWNPAGSRWNEVDFTCGHAGEPARTTPEQWRRGLFSIPPTTGKVRYEVFGTGGTETWDWQGNGWSHALVDPGIMNATPGGRPGAIPTDADLDGDGHADRLAWIQRQSDGTLRLTAFRRLPGSDRADAAAVSLAMPTIESIASDAPLPWSELEQTRGVRLIDLNQDGSLDLVVSNPTEFGAWLLYSDGKPPQQLLHGKRGAAQGAEIELPVIVRGDGTENGFFVKDRQLCWINEETDGQADFIRRVAFDTLLGDRLPEAKSPSAARQSMRVTAGYRVDLVASEPLTMDPVALDWGADGKLWVVEMADYPQGTDGQGRPGGRVRYLEDRDGDGKYEQSTLFLQDIPFPNGVLAWNRGVLVSAAPDLFYAEDTNGDGRADVKKVLFTGFAEGNQQHRVNGFSRGLDNWLYLANGDSGGTVRVVAALGGPIEEKSFDIRGRDIRIRPQTGEIEAVAGQSQFGRNRDDWGNWFGNNNSRPMWHYLLDDHYLRRNPFLAAPNLLKDVSVTPGAAPVFPSSRTLTRFNDFHAVNRFTSACSSMVYRDNLLGRDAPGTTQVFTSEPVHNLVHREIMRPDGLSFTSQRAAGEQQSEFLSSTDNWFRPTQIKTGPDGALYVADMYRLVIEHPQWIPIEWQRKLDLRAGQDRGRIWRIAPIDVDRRPVPRLDTMTIPQLVAALRHDNGWQRDLAQQLLIDRADPASIPLLAAQAVSRPETQIDLRTQALGRLHSLCTLEGLTGFAALRDPARQALRELLPAALADSDPGVRRHAVRLYDGVPEPTDLHWQALAALVDDPDPQVRLQLAYTLGDIRDPRAGTVLGRIAIRGAAPEVRRNPHFTAAVISSLNATNLEPVLSEVMTNGPGETELLQQLLAQATAFNHEPSLTALLNKATAPANGGYAPWQFSAVEQFLVSLDRRSTTLEKWTSGLSPAARPVANRLQAMQAAAFQLAGKADAPLPDRLAAVRVLVRPDDAPLLAELITPRQPPELQLAALAMLARSKSGDVARVLLSNYRSLAPNLRAQAADILLRREQWRDELLAALDSKELSPSDLDATARQRLLDDKSKSVAERSARLLAVDLNSNRAKLVAEYLPTVRAGGDAQLGSQLFKKMCAQCHKLGNVGHAVGPDLMALTDKSADALIAAVLDPNRAVEAKFLTFTAITRDGITHTGLMAAETAASFTLRGAEAKEVTLLRQEVDELQSNARSLMPEGLEKDLKPADAAALVAYIRLNVPLPAPKSFPGNAPKVVSADPQGKFSLFPLDAEIYGPTIVVEEKHGNLGWWSSADDIVVWTIDVPRPGKYAVSWTYACERSAAGNRLVIEAAGKSLTHRVQQTGGWDDYQVQSIGEVELPGGQVRLTLKPASRPLPALGDVKLITLSPAN